MTLVSTSLYYQTKQVTMHGDTNLLHKAATASTTTAAPNQTKSLQPPLLKIQGSQP